MDKGADTEVKDSWLRTTLYYALENDHGEIAKLLVAHGSDTNTKDNRGRMSLDIAFQDNDKDNVGLLLAKGAEVLSIHIVACIGDLAKVKAFHEKGVDINARGP